MEYHDLSTDDLREIHSTLIRAREAIHPIRGNQARLLILDASIKKLERVLQLRAETKAMLQAEDRS